MITISYLGISVLVPSPEAFALHKMIINEDRREDKAVKDREAIINMYPYLDKEKLNSIYETLSKNEKTKINIFLNQYIIV